MRPRPGSQGGRVDAERARRPGEPGRGLIPAGSQPDLLQEAGRDRDDRRGVDRVARRDEAGASRRAGGRGQVEPGLVAPHPVPPRPPPGPPPPPPPTTPTPP